MGFLAENFMKLFVYRLILIAAMGVTIFILLLLLNSSQNAAVRMESNFEQQEGNARLFMTTKEFKSYITRDSAKFAFLYRNIDSLKLKLRKITNVTRIENHYYSNDTTIIQTVADISGRYPINFNNGCLKYSGSFDIDSKQYFHLSGSFDDEINIIDFWQRQPLFKNRPSLKWIKHPFKRIYLREIISKCGESTYEEIEIKRKKD